MKIRAIRVAEFGRFGEPVAIEGLSGRLDVLAGPNELGKSTLLAALRLALFEKHTARNEHVREATPYGGGAPTVEVEFDAQGARWRIRKRFLGQAGAELCDLDSGTRLRGADAEAKLEALIGGEGGRSQLRLLWVGQQEALAGRRNAEEAYAAVAGAHGAIEDTLAAEVGALAEGRHARMVRKDVQRRLAENLTPGGQTKLNGPLDQARKAAERLRREASEAKGRLETAERQLADLQRITEQIRALEDPAEQRKRRDAQTRALAAVEEAKEALRRRDRALQTLKAAESEVARWRAAVEQFMASEQDLKAADEQIAADGLAVSALKARRTALEQDVAEAQMRARAAQEALERLEGEYALAVAAERRAAAQTRLAELESRADALSRIETEAGGLAAALAANSATATLAEAARRELEAIRALEAQRDAAAPTISMTYHPDARGRLTIAGRPLEPGELVQLTAAAKVAIPGLGELTVAPGRTAETAEIEADLQARREQLAALLARASARDFDHLEALCRERALGEARYAELMAQRAALAPAGVSGIRAEMAEVRRAIENAPRGEARGVDAVEADRHAARQTLADRRGEHERSVAALAACRAELDRLETRIEAVQRQKGALLARLPPPEARAAHRSNLDAALKAAEDAANAARREVTAWSEAAPSPEAQRQLQADLETAAAAARAADKELVDLKTAAARLEGALAAARNEDIAARESELADQLAAAEARLAEISLEVAALRMIEAELAAEEARARDRYLEPVLARLRPLITFILPQADVMLGPEFGPSAIIRGGQREELRRLSDGTREQIAVLARLGFARLFADAGRPVPVILDDALVYADDWRIAQMFKTLAAAAEHHQVIVLTCRMRAFEGLGGTRLTLAPWARSGA
jgi:chromosome segregation ATPase